MVLTRRALTQLGFPEKSASLIENIHPAVIENQISKLESGRQGKRQKKKTKKTPRNYRNKNTGTLHRESTD